MLWIYLQPSMWIDRGTLMVKFADPNPEGYSSPMGMVKNVQWQDGKVIVLIKKIKTGDFAYLQQFAC